MIYFPSYLSLHLIPPFVPTFKNIISIHNIIDELANLLRTEIRFLIENKGKGEVNER